MGAKLYDQVVKILEDLLGPAAERYVYRLIGYHLKKEPEDLVASDIPKLVKWIKVSLALLTEDKLLIDDCEKKLIELKIRKI